MFIVCFLHRFYVGTEMYGTSTYSSNHSFWGLSCKCLVSMLVPVGHLGCPAKQLACKYYFLHATKSKL